MLEPEIARILNLSDEQILAEVRAEGKDPEQVAAEGLAIFERALAQSQGWLIHMNAFRATLIELKCQDMTIRELRRLLLLNRATTNGVTGLPQEIAACINGLERG